MTRFDPSGRTALVTAGSSGIGLALARHLLGAGAARVLIVGRDEGRLLAAAQALGPRAEPLRADLSRSDEVDGLLARVSALAPDLSLLVNNAGGEVLIDLADGAPAAHLPRLRAENAANLDAVVALSVGLLPLLARQPTVAPVNVTSGLALAPKASAPVYCATKAGVRSFTTALRYQCEARMPQVRIVEALPPLVDTAIRRGAGAARSAPRTAPPRSSPGCGPAARRSTWARRASFGGSSASRPRWATTLCGGAEPCRPRPPRSRPRRGAAVVPAGRRGLPRLRLPRAGAA